MATDTDTTSDTERATVLVVDDEERVADTYEMRLRDTYDTLVAYDGDDALERVDDAIDVVLLDRRMPEPSGDEVLEEIRRQGIDVRVVLLTAVDPDFDIVDMQCDDYVVKPVDKESLHAVVERALKIAAYNDRMQELSSKKLKRNVLEVELPQPELRESDKYRLLCDEIGELEAKVGELEDDLNLDDPTQYL